jgi:hypothetical protein
MINVAQVFIHYADNYLPGEDHRGEKLISTKHIIPVIVIPRMLGHVKPSTTLDVYGHLLPKMQIEAAEKIDVLITPVAVQLVAPGCTRLHPEEALP